MDRIKTNFLITLTIFATFLVLIGPFVGAIHPLDMALLTTSVGIMGTAYFALVSPKRDKVSPLITLLFLGFSALSSSAAGVLTYDGIVQALLLGFIFILLVFMEIGTWFYTAVYEVNDIPPALEQTLPNSILPDNHNKMNDPANTDKNLNRER